MFFVNANMNWRRVHKTIERKPYLLDPLRVRNVGSAKKMLLQEGMPSHSHMLHTGCQLSGMNQAQWEAFLGVSEKRLLRKSRMTAPVRVGTLTYISRRALVAVILVAATFFLMACTPTGRALTRAIYNSVVEIVEDILYVGVEQRTDTPQELVDLSPAEDTVEYFSSLEEALAAIDEPIYYLNDADAAVDRICFTSSVLFGNSLETEYVFQNEVHLIFRQVWREGQPDRIIFDENKRYNRFYIADSIMIDGSYSQDDKRFIGTISTDTIIVHICIEGTHSLEDALLYLQPLNFR